MRIINRNREHTFNPDYIVAICIFFIFWTMSMPYSGPAYLSDEIGYLSHAAIISGNIIDGATKWHAGYSIVLAPFFVIFSEPENIWRAAMFLNALLWALSFLLLGRFISELMPNSSTKNRILILFISAIYPT